MPSGNPGSEDVLINMDRTDQIQCWGLSCQSFIVVTY
jgi:hypothetical protein